MTVKRPKLLIATHNPGKVREYRDLLGDVPFELASLSDVGINKEVDETGDTFEANARLKACEYAVSSGILTLADDSGLEVDALGGQPGVRSARYGDDSPLASAKKGRLSDHDRLQLLLHNLYGVPWDRRTARFRCVIAVAGLNASRHPDSIPLATRHSVGPHSFCRSKGPHPHCHSEERSDEESKLPSRQPNPTARDNRPASESTLLEGSVEGVIQYEPMGNNGFGYDPVFYLPSYGLTMAQLPMEEKNRISHRAPSSPASRGPAPPIPWRQPFRH